MTTYICFESAIHMISVGYVVPMLVLMFVAAFGLAVIETVEEVNEL